MSTLGQEHQFLFVRICPFSSLALVYVLCTSSLIISVSETLPTGQLSNVPWRRSGVKYTNNEAYFDVIEEVDAIIDKNGSTVSAEIHGYVSTFAVQEEINIL